MSLQVFNQFANLARTEVIAQAVEKFNAASRGAIILSAGSNVGDFSQVAYYANIANLIRRRNMYGTGSVSATSISQLLEASVKVAAGTPPIEYQPSLWENMMKNPEEAGSVIGQQLGVGQMQDMLNTAITAIVAAFENVGATVVYDGTAAGITLAKLNSGAALFGDRSQSIAAWVMHSTQWHALIAAGLTNTERLFTFENVSIMQDAMGRPFIVTDSPSLVEADGVSAGVDKYSILGLVANGAIVEANNDFASSVIDIQGKDNLLKSYQAEWTYNLGLKGYTWDMTNGGKSPNDAALGTGTNWDKTASNVKDTAGVAVQVR